MDAATQATETKSSDSVGQLCTPQNYECEMQRPTNLVQLHGSVPIRQQLWILATLQSIGHDGKLGRAVGDKIFLTRITTHNLTIIQLFSLAM